MLNCSCTRHTATHALPHTTPAYKRNRSIVRRPTAAILLKQSFQTKTANSCSLGKELHKPII